MLATPYSEEVGRSVVDALFQIAYNNALRSHIPIDIWAWLKRRPSLLPVCKGRIYGSTPDVVRYIRKLGDIEILKSYFLLVWSEWDILYSPGLREMKTTVREEFCGILMQHHREDLIIRLDYVLGQLDRGLEYFKQHNSKTHDAHIQYGKERYGELKELLVEMDKEVMRA